MVKDLRTFLANWGQKHPEDIITVEKEISVKWKVPALQSKLERMGKHPILIFNKPLNVKGEMTPYRLIANLLASRIRSAESMGINPKELAIKCNEKISRKIPPITVTREDAPVKEVVMKGKDVNLHKFPIVWHHEMDAGPYITAGLVTTYDPDTSVHNSALQRCWVKNERKTGLHMALGTHNRFNVEKFFRNGKDAPVAVWVGHHPAVMFGIQARLDYPVDHYPVAGGTLGEPLRLVPTELYGEKLLVPADSEVVIEGVIPKDYYEAEGPFGEYTKYQGPQEPGVVIDVKYITCRKDAYWHDFLGGHMDGTMPGMFPLEAAVYENVRRVVPEVLEVRRAAYGLNMYVKIKKDRPGIAKNVILAALATDPRRIKYVFVFDDDIDIFDDAQILWALATRSQLDIDLIMVPNAYNGASDPSVPYPSKLGTAAGFDCTRPSPAEPGLPSPFSPVAKIPDEILEEVKLEDYFSLKNIERIPKEETYW
jgi:2,5-furandicarboxylate decarboxylase 1